MSNSSKKIAILVEDMYQVLEVWYPALRLDEEGIETVFVGTGTKDSYSSKEGYPARADVSIEDISADQVDGVIIPGGFAPDFMRRYPKMVQFVKDLDEKGKVVASICHGGWMLVSADILKGRKATSFFAIKSDLVAAGANFVDVEVAVDKNLITSRKPEDLPAFMVEIIKQLR
ncbi:Intracellular protease [hydrothermal vent metagenome]|uniref:Intracellular protease n=1 Tax=hydrothermal vent metagenome TaxID=652676 RepID=A0A3B0U790_9ZZZZ